MMLAGFGKAELTPPLGVELAGYGYYLARRALRVEDPTFARAVALERDGTVYLLISCDILGLNREIAAQVRQEMQLHHGIIPERVTLVSIHTHSAAPAIYHEGCGEVDADYVRTIAPTIIRACEAALEDRREVTGLRFSCTDIGGDYVYNRACAGGPVDRMVRAFFVTRRDAPELALISFPCHAVCNGKTTGISADYPGQVCRLMQEKTGAEPMFINGLCGDIDPLPCGPENRQAQRARFAGAIVKAACADKQPLPMTVTGGCLHEMLRLMPVTLASIHEAADRAAGREQAIPGGDRVARVWEQEMVRRFDTLDGQEPIDVHYLTLGGVPVVALPFEGFTDIGRLIRREAWDQRAVTLGCADQLLGYLPTRDDIERGAYAALESTFLYKRLPVRPGEAERLGVQIGRRLHEA